MFKVSPYSALQHIKYIDQDIKTQDKGPTVEATPLDPLPGTERMPDWDLSQEETNEFVEDTVRELLEKHLSGLGGELPAAPKVGYVSPDDLGMALFNSLIALSQLKESLQGVARHTNYNPTDDIDTRHPLIRSLDIIELLQSQIQQYIDGDPSFGRDDLPMLMMPDSKLDTISFSTGIPSEFIVPGEGGLGGFQPTPLSPWPHENEGAGRASSAGGGGASSGLGSGPSSGASDFGGAVTGSTSSLNGGGSRTTDNAGSSGSGTSSGTSFSGSSGMGGPTSRPNVGGNSSTSSGSSGMGGPSTRGGHRDGNTSTDDAYLGFPILLDLNGNGIELTELPESTRFMDANGDGLRNRTAWAAAGDAVLFYDPDGRNAITEARQYIFSEWDPTAGSDVEALRAVFDTNGDGKLTAADANFSKFKLMVTNANGSTSVVTLATLGIVEMESDDEFKGPAFPIGLPVGITGGAWLCGAL